MLFLVVGSVLFGVATLRAGMLPRLGGLLAAIWLPIGVLGGILSAVTGLLAADSAFSPGSSGTLGAAWVMVGYAVWSDGGRATQRSARQVDVGGASFRERVLGGKKWPISSPSPGGCGRACGGARPDDAPEDRTLRATPLRRTLVLVKRRLVSHHAMPAGGQEAASPNPGTRPAIVSRGGDRI